MFGAYCDVANCIADAYAVCDNYCTLSLQWWYFAEKNNTASCTFSKESLYLEMHVNKVHNFKSGLRVITLYMKLDTCKYPAYYPA